MNTVIITADGPEHRFVTKCLVESLGGRLSGVVIERGGKQSLVTSLRNAYKRYGGYIVIERIMTKFVLKLLRTSKRQTSCLDKIIGRHNPETYMSSEIPILEVASANHKECLNWIEDINPDYIFVYGTGIIGNRVLSLPALQTLNLHTGISPFYRGSSCAFWPLYNNEPLMVGSTIHKCTPEVDGGDIYGRVSIRLSKGDDPYSAFAKSVRAGAILYADIAKRLVNKEDLTPKKQDFSLGREYRFKDKTFLKELAMEYRILTGKLDELILCAQESPLPFPDSVRGER